MSRLLIDGGMSVLIEMRLAGYIKGVEEKIMSFREQLVAGLHQADQLREARLAHLLDMVKTAALEEIRSGYASRYFYVPGMNSEREAVDVSSRLFAEGMTARVTQKDFAWGLELDFQEILTEVAAEKLAGEMEAKCEAIAESVAGPTTGPRPSFSIDTKNGDVHVYLKC